MNRSPGQKRVLPTVCSIAGRYCDRQPQRAQTKMLLLVNGRKEDIPTPAKSVNERRALGVVAILAPMLIAGTIKRLFIVLTILTVPPPMKRRTARGKWPALNCTRPRAGSLSSLSLGQNSKRRPQNN